MEQAKHVLRRKLSVAQSEGESRVLELHSDLKDLRSKLDVQEASVRQAEREKAALIEELSAQNTRLTSQLQEATQIEAQLTNQLQEIRDQCSLRSTSLQVKSIILNINIFSLKGIWEIKTHLFKYLSRAYIDFFRLHSIPSNHFHFLIYI